MKKKKTRRQRLEKELDYLTAKIIKIQNNYTCQKCGKYVTGRNCHASHIIPKTRHALRWNLINLMVLCLHDHRDWWHTNILEAQKWFKEKFPEKYKYLMKHKEDSGRFTLDELEELKVKLKQEIDELQQR